MDTFTTTKGSVTGPDTASIELSATGPVSTDGVVINAGGELAGTSSDNAGQHAFLTDASGNTTSFTAAAGEQNISVAGIDTAGDVIGGYEDGAEVQHGYVYANGTATTVDPTGSASTTVTTVDPSGTFAGTYRDASGTTRGFVDRAGTITSFDVTTQSIVRPVMQPGPFQMAIQPAAVTQLSGVEVSAVDASGEAAGVATANSDDDGNDTVFVERGGTVTSYVLPNGGIDAAVAGISETGVVAGSYLDPDSGRYVGFTLAPGAESAAPLTITNGQNIRVSGVDAAGDVVGTYFDTSVERDRGFVRKTAGAITEFDGSSSATSTSVTGISPSGTVFGTYKDAAGQHPFEAVGGTVSTIPSPANAGSANPTGADAAGDVVGSYYLQNGGDGFGVGGGQATFIDRTGNATSQQVTVQGQLQPPFVTGIDPADDLVGIVSDANGTHVFIDKGGVFTTFDASATAPGVHLAGIDANGDVFGGYQDADPNDSAGKTHGFVERNGTVTTVDVDPNGQRTEIQAVSAGGDFAGVYGSDREGAEGLFVSRGGQISLVTNGIPTSNQNTFLGIDALAMNASDTVAGNYTAEISDEQSYRSVGFTVGADNTATAVNVAGAQDVVIEGIDDAGDVFGQYSTDGNDYVGFVQTSDGKTTTYMGPDGTGDTDVFVEAIDAAGDIVGGYRDTNNNDHVFLQKAGTTATVQLDAALNDASAQTVGLDAAGDIAGNYSNADGSQHGFLYNAGSGQIATVDGSPTATSTSLTGIDAAGDVFGTYTDASGAQHSFVAFAAGMPTITGTHASSTTAEAPVAPFGGVTIGDANANATETLTVALSGGGGMLRDGAGHAGLKQTGTNTYQLTGTASAVTAELDALSFTPTAGTPGAANPTTFTLTDVSNVAGSNTDTVTDANTVVTDTAAATANPGGSTNPGGVSTNPGQPVSAGTVSFDDQVTHSHGAFTLTGRVSGTAGLSAVEITADVDGTATDLGAATVDANGNFSFKDAIGAHTQGFITATATDAGGTASAQAAFALTGGLSEGKVRAEQDRYSADGSTETAIDRFKANGSQTADLLAPGQTFGSAFFDTFDNGGAPESTFVFDPGFGRDTVDLFRVDGVDHDTLSFRGSDYGNDIATVLNAAHDTKAGLLITDPTASSPGGGSGTHDTLLLKGVTKQQFAQNRGDIAFHA